jgi:hypothetical protein
MMVEKHLQREDNPMGSEDCKPDDLFVHKGDKHFVLEEGKKSMRQCTLAPCKDIINGKNKVFVVLKDFVPQRIADFPEKECAKDFVSHSVHTMGYGLQSEISPQAEIVSRFEFDPQMEVEFLEGSRN